MSRRTSCAVLVAAIGLATWPLLAESFKNPPSEPLLVVRSFNTAQGSLPLQPPDPRVWMHTIFVFSDRTLVHTISISPQWFAIRPQLASYTRGRVPARAWNTLRSAMAAVDIGTLEDCNVVRPGGPHSDIGETAITWYGRQGRKNAFTLWAGADAVPFCGLAEMTLLSAIFEGARKVADTSTAEHFVTP